MATHRRTWQKREQAVAEFFGAKRQPGSGSSGREDQTRSDSTHPRLYIEHKLRPTHSARTLREECRGKASIEYKTPVVALSDKSRPGFMICVHSDDFDAVAIERLRFIGYTVTDRGPSEITEMGRKLEDECSTG